MKISIINSCKDIKLDLKLLEKAAHYISNKFDKDPTSGLNIIFTGKEEIRELNKKYRNIDSVTDVLSFSYISDKNGLGTVEEPFIIGEIFISPGVAKANAAEQGKGWNLVLEIVLLIIHGMLHIYDYDHETEGDRLDMENLQNSLLNDACKTFKL